MVEKAGGNRSDLPAEREAPPLLLIYWLAALARGARAYAHAQTFLSSPLARLIYLALIASFWPMTRFPRSCSR